MFGKWKQNGRVVKKVWLKLHVCSQTDVQIKVLEAKHQEEKLKLQQRHDADIEKVRMKGRQLLLHFAHLRCISSSFFFTVMGSSNFLSVQIWRYFYRVINKKNEMYFFFLFVKAL